MTFETSLFRLLSNLEGLKEIAGAEDNPFILWCLSICHVPKPLHDEIPWCSAMMNGICEIAGVERSYSAAARSWLRVGLPVDLRNAQVGMDIVILKRGQGEQPGPEVLNAPGHVGLYGGIKGDKVDILAGNQGNRVCIAPFSVSLVLGVRRLRLKG